VSTCAEKIVLCLPRSKLATCDARRPSTMSVASMTCQLRVISPGFGVYVRTCQPYFCCSRGAHLSSRTCLEKQARLQRLPAFTGFGQNEPRKSGILPILANLAVPSAQLLADLQRTDRSKPATGQRVLTHESPLYGPPPYPRQD